MAIPEHSVVNDITPVCKHLTQSAIKAQGTASPTTSAASPPIIEAEKETAKPEKPAAAYITHPELDTLFLEDFHRRRQQQKAKDQQQKQKRKAERAKERAQTVAVNSALRPAKKLPGAGVKEKGILPPNRVLFPLSSSSSLEKKEWEGGRKSPEKEKKSSTTTTISSSSKKKKQQQRQGLPPRLPSKSRKPSQSPDAYEKARRISGLHELVGSSLGIRA